MDRVFLIVVDSSVLFVELWNINIPYLRNLNKDIWNVLILYVSLDIVLCDKLISYLGF